MQKPSAEQSINKLVNAIHRIAKENNPLGVQIGTVVKAPPEIEIAMNDIILTKENLYVDQFLCSGYSRSTQGDMSLSNLAGSFGLDDASGNVSVSGSTSDF